MREIQNASTTRAGKFPEMGGVLPAWSDAITFTKITNATVDFENEKTETAYSFQGVLEPQSARELILKPEGQRGWKYSMLWVKNGYDIALGDIIISDEGVRYKVMKSNNWNKAGYGQFELLEDYLEVGA